jgi:7-keto-8-aminopelargonate synthetase-like enzyme
VAGYFGCEAAVVVGSGYLANLVLLQAIGDGFTHLFADEAAHSSLVDAAGGLGRQLARFAHCDPGDLRSRLAASCTRSDRPLILTDGVFPARGEMPPLDQYARIAREFSGRVLVDDAHGVGVVGARGRGSLEVFGLTSDDCFLTGTLSKGFGTYGGIIPGSSALLERIRQKSSAFVGSTGLPLPLAAAAIASIDLLTADRDRIRGLQSAALAFKSELRDAGFEPPSSPAPIVSITHGDEERNRRLADLLLEGGIYPPFVNYPGAPQGGHFRFALSSAHRGADLGRLADAIIRSR